MTKKITSDQVAAVLGLGFAMLAVAVVLAAAVIACRPGAPAAPVNDARAPLVISAAACRRKGLDIIAAADGGTCVEKRARLATLVTTDPDCADLFLDAGPVIQCRDAGVGR